jgi:hypothetical protein
LLKLLLVFAKIVIITLVFEENAIFSPKIGKNFITSTPGSKEWSLANIFFAGNVLPMAIHLPDLGTTLHFFTLLHNVEVAISLSSFFVLLAAGQ